MIYVSTGGYQQWSFSETIEHLASVGLMNFELSGGQYVSNIEEKLQTVAKQYHVILHNYFPPPKTPFVFNLASMQPNIAEVSMRHARKVIDLSSLIGAGYYSFHAGYLIDPQVYELGRQIGKQQLSDRRTAMYLFIERVNELSDYARRKNVKLLIENNVLSVKNWRMFGENPFLMVDHDETAHVIERTDDNVGLLIDVAHLKVSANTLGFDSVDYLKVFVSEVSAYHLSDGEGLEDSNEPIDHNAWFWPYINPDLDYYSLEIYNIDKAVLKKQVEILRKHVHYPEN